MRVLPAANGGANAAVTLKVALLGGLFSESSRFFQGICLKPQADEDALFKHPVVRAGVQVKWERYARPRFLLIFGWYVLFVTLFTCWSIAEPLADVEKIGPRPLSVVTLASMLPLLFVEFKQAYKVGLRSHFSLWNVLAALVLGSISVSIVLSEATNVAAASVIRVIHWYCFPEPGSN